MTACSINLILDSGSALHFLSSFQGSCFFIGYRITISVKLLSGRVGMGRPQPEPAASCGIDFSSLFCNPAEDGFPHDARATTGWSPAGKAETRSRVRNGVCAPRFAARLKPVLQLKICAERRWVGVPPSGGSAKPGAEWCVRTPRANGPALYQPGASPQEWPRHNNKGLKARPIIQFSMQRRPWASVSIMKVEVEGARSRMDRAFSPH